VSKVDAYRTQMIARKAAAAGMSVEAFLAKGERDAAITRRANELRYTADRGQLALIWHCVAIAIRERRTHEFTILTAA